MYIYVMLVFFPFRHLLHTSYHMPHFSNECISYIHSSLHKSHCAFKKKKKHPDERNEEQYSNKPCIQSKQHTAYISTPYTFKCFPMHASHLKYIQGFEMLKVFNMKSLCSVFSVHASTFNILHWILCVFHNVVSSQKHWNSYLV